MRLAVVGGAGRPPLLFEQQEQEGSGPTGSSGDEWSDPPPLITRELPASNTLLSAALAGRSAQIISDCAAYLQNCPAAPAADLFGLRPGAAAAAAVVVVPLAVRGEAVGALYFSQAGGADVANYQDILLVSVGVACDWLVRIEDLSFHLSNVQRFLILIVRNPIAQVTNPPCPSHSIHVCRVWLTV